MPLYALSMASAQITENLLISNSLIVCECEDDAHAEETARTLGAEQFPKEEMWTPCVIQYYDLSKMKDGVWYDFTRHPATTENTSLLTKPKIDDTLPLSPALPSK